MAISSQNVPFLPDSLLHLLSRLWKISVDSAILCLHQFLSYYKYHIKISVISSSHSVSISFLLFSEADLYSFHFPLLIQSWMVFVSLAVLNRLCFSQCSSHASQGPAPMLSPYSFKFLTEFFLCLSIPTCILSFIFSGKLLKNCFIYFTPHTVQHFKIFFPSPILCSLSWTICSGLPFTADTTSSNVSLSSLSCDTTHVSCFFLHIPLLLLRWSLIQLFFSLFTFFPCLWSSSFIELFDWWLPFYSPSISDWTVAFHLLFSSL